MEKITQFKCGKIYLNEEDCINCEKHHQGVWYIKNKKYDPGERYPYILTIRFNDGSSKCFIDAKLTYQGSWVDCIDV